MQQRMGPAAETWFIPWKTLHNWSSCSRNSAHSVRKIRRLASLGFTASDPVRLNKALETKRKILPLVWLFLMVDLMIALHYLVPILLYRHALLQYAGVAVGAFGMVMMVMSAGAFRKAGTGLVPFDEATALVTDGFFRLTRNPLYLGMVLLMIGLAMILGSLSALAPIPVFAWIIQRNFIRGEERFMEAAFGQQYLDYMNRVRRWL